LLQNLSAAIAATFNVVDAQMLGRSRVRGWFD
jgi:hypothetical protein